jgi:hypothetical protein
LITDSTPKADIMRNLLRPAGVDPSDFDIIVGRSSEQIELRGTATVVQ